MNLVKTFKYGRFCCRHFVQGTMRLSSNQEPVLKVKSNVIGKYSENEVREILNVFNDYQGETFESLHLNTRTVKSVEEYISKNQKFTNLNQILEVHGVGPRAFQKICNVILNKEVSTDENSNNNKGNLFQQILIPHITEDQRKEARIVTGVEIGFSTISWTRLDYINKKIEWNLLNYIDHVDLKNMTNMYNFILNMKHKIPKADLYAMENNNWGVQRTQTSLVRHMSASQATAILLVLLNNHHDDTTKETPENRVFFIKNLLPTRYFKTLIGAEKVSPQKMVEDMFEGIFPNCCSPVTFEQRSIELYLKQQKAFRENLCGSLLLTLTFMELVLNGKNFDLKPTKKRKLVV